MQDAYTSRAFFLLDEIQIPSDTHPAPAQIKVARED